MAQANFTVVQGDTFLRTCTFRNKDSQVAVNLTGATITGLAGGTALTCVITDEGNGIFTFGLNTTETAALELGVNALEIQVTYIDLTVRTLIQTSLVVVAQIV